MLNYIWSGLVIISITCSIIFGNTSNLSKALIDSGASSIELIFTMAGIMCLWSGIMKIAVESGFTSAIAKLFAPLLRPLFPKLNKNSAAFKSITMNISANLLGLGNAATPFGLKAMEQLHTLNNKSDTASNEMVNSCRRIFLSQFYSWKISQFLTNYFHILTIKRTRQLPPPLCRLVRK